MNANTKDTDVYDLLIVDDDDSFQLVIKQAIAEGGGYRIRSADSGEQALEALQQDRFDVIILDYRMPGISGLNVLQWMYEQKIDTPVIMMTAAGSETVAVEAMKLGAYDYIRKEQIDVSHIRVLLDGVVERYMFRKEKERREAIEHERDKSLVAIETYHSTLASIAQIVNNSLSMVSLNIRKHETKLAPFFTDEGLRQLFQVFGDLEQDYSVIASAVKSMLDMANVLHGNFTQANYAERLQELMNGNLKNLQKSGVLTPLAEMLEKTKSHEGQSATTRVHKPA